MLWMHIIYKNAVSKKQIKELDITSVANKITDLGNSISLKYKTLLLQSLAILLFKQFQYSKEEIKQILDAILNPGKEKKERSTTP